MKKKQKSLLEVFYSKSDIKAMKEGIFNEPEKIPEDVRERAFSAIKEYTKYSKMIYREGNLVDVAKTLAEIAEFASRYTVEEANDWFDTVTIKRNMNELKKYASDFGKVAKEVQAHQNRMTALYEDMGRLLGRYFDIAEMVEEEQPETANVDTFLRQGDRAKVNMNRVREHNPEPRYVRQVQEEIRKGGGTVKINELNENTAKISGGDVNLYEIEVPTKSLTKIVGRLYEVAKYDEEKMKKYIKTDKFLQHAAKTSSPKAVFNAYVLGDSAMEKKYNAVK